MASLFRDVAPLTSTRPTRRNVLAGCGYQSGAIIPRRIAPSSRSLTQAPSTSPDGSSPPTAPGGYLGRERTCPSHAVRVELGHSVALQFPARSLSCRLDRIRPLSGPAASCSSRAHPGAIDFGSDPTPWASWHKWTVSRPRPWHPRQRSLTSTSASDCPEHSGCSWSISRTGYGVVWPHRHRTFSHRPRRVRIVQAIATTRSKGGTTDGMRRNITSTRGGSRVERSVTGTSTNADVIGPCPVWLDWSGQ